MFWLVTAVSFAIWRRALAVSPLGSARQDEAPPHRPGALAGRARRGARGAAQVRVVTKPVPEME
jgi:hypothetical protein